MQSFRMQDLSDTTLILSYLKLHGIVSLNSHTLRSIISFIVRKLNYRFKNLLTLNFLPEVLLWRANGQVMVKNADFGSFQPENHFSGELTLLPVPEAIAFGLSRAAFPTLTPTRAYRLGR